MEHLRTDLLIIGGGTAGCFAAVEARKQAPDLDVTILEKAHIDRSGCLGMGINAINAYITPGQSVESFAAYVENEGVGVVRHDLVRTIAAGLNEAVHEVEDWGLPVVREPDGSVSARGRASIRIHGERLKPILARSARDSGARVLNRVFATNYALDESGRVRGVFGFGVRDGKFYFIEAKATLCATGGASGIYRPNNPGDARHRMWYCPFNVGSGLAMGIRAGAEMTSFEMRFVALRVRDVNAPTGTIAQGVNLVQTNAQGEEYLRERYTAENGAKLTTAHRLHALLSEERAGRGPSYLDTRRLDADQLRQLKEVYLTMAPPIVLLWADPDHDPTRRPIEISGSEPYVLGGHGSAGYWIDVNRRTTTPGLYAAGDVAGGAPKKYASGAWVEAKLAVRDALTYLRDLPTAQVTPTEVQREEHRVVRPLARHWEKGFHVTPLELEDRLQKVMDEYAGGISCAYETCEGRLLEARKLLGSLREQTALLVAHNPYDLMLAHETIDRIDVARVLVEHMLHRKESRWPVYQSRSDYPERDDERWRVFVNSTASSEGQQIQTHERACNDAREEYTESWE